jgi:hypothetical protein
MAKTDFSWVNAIDGATFTAGSQAATLPASNLAQTRMGRVWRSLAATSWFQASFAAATAIDVLALGGAGLASTDQVRHRLYDAGGSLLLDVTEACGVLDGYALHVHLLASPLTVASWRCDITATSRAGLGYFDIKRAWAGPKFQPAIGISRPFDDGWQDDAANMRGKLSGGFFGGDGPQYRAVNLVLNYIADGTEKAQVKEMLRVAGRRGQVLAIPDEAGDIPREAILGHFDKLQLVGTSNDDVIPPVYSQSFSIIQDL